MSSDPSSDRPSSTSPVSGLNAPKFGTLIPNRIFVGGISPSTTEAELHALFSKYGNVKATKIIADRAGVSKGYGFVTFETEEEAKRIQAESENLVLKDRKLNIAPAIKKQPFGRIYNDTTIMPPKNQHNWYQMEPSFIRMVYLVLIITEWLFTLFPILYTKFLSHKHLILWFMDNQCMYLSNSSSINQQYLHNGQPITSGIGLQLPPLCLASTYILPCHLHLQPPHKPHQSFIIMNSYLIRCTHYLTPTKCSWLHILPMQQQRTLTTLYLKIGVRDISPLIPKQPSASQRTVQLAWEGTIFQSLLLDVKGLEIIPQTRNIWFLKW
ncbi:uncharacterized protein LOC143252636 isoform X3 [Tachypleus tridentatus]|uniref:uncharacterized protein LOC143252636 isoform X3 n=1 Tax=Tachypleus tridentatus TaxID=6853 RepID=UPI003FD49CFE